MKVRFEELQFESSSMILSDLFDILYKNMVHIAPTGCSYDEDKQIWLDYIMPQIAKNESSIILMFVDNRLAGYFQYRIDEDILWVEELEIKSEFQLTKLFYLFCQYLVLWRPSQIQYVYSYVRKDNRKSLLIHEHLDMERIGENKAGTSWLYRGYVARMAAQLRRR